MEISNEELAFLDNMIEDTHSKVRHGVSEYAEEEQALLDSLYEKVFSEAKKRKLWWAR